MELWKIWLFAAAILILVSYFLYYFGFFTTHETIALFRAERSLPTRWQGKYTDTSGSLRRNFVVFKKYSTLSVEVETASGALSVEVKAPNGSILSPVSGAYETNSPVLFDMSRFKRCSVLLQMDHFHGQFLITLQ